MNRLKSKYEPKFIYVIIHIDCIDHEYIEFSLDREYVIEQIFKKPYKVFFLLEHGLTYGLKNKEIPYHMVYSKCKFYPEKLNYAFIPLQEWIPTNIHCLLQREISSKIERKYPELYFCMLNHYGFKYLSVRKDPYEKRADFLEGKVLWSKQKLNY